MYLLLNLERKLTAVGTMIRSIMQKGCAATVIINMAEPKNHGIAHITNYMLTECAKIAILMATIRKEENRKESKDEELSNNELKI
jgi:hypothetical protein